MLASIYHTYGSSGTDILFRGFSRASLVCLPDSRPNGVFVGIYQWRSPGHIIQKPGDLYGASCSMKNCWNLVKFMWIVHLAFAVPLDKFFLFSGWWEHVGATNIESKMWVPACTLWFLRTYLIWDISGYTKYTIRTYSVLFRTDEDILGYTRTIYLYIFVCPDKKAVGTRRPTPL